MKYSDFVKKMMAHPEIRKLNPKQRMGAIAQRWRSQKGKGGKSNLSGGGMSNMDGGGMSNLSGGGGGKKRKAGKKRVYAMRGGSLLGPGGTLTPANQRGHGMDQEGDGFWSDFQKGFTDVIGVAAKAAPLLALL